VAAIEGLGRRALSVACDMSHWDEVEALAAIAYETFGHIDVLVNNAGTGSQQAIVDITQADFDHMFSVDVRGPMQLAGLVAKNSTGGKPVSIINITSAAATQPVRNTANYCAAKAALQTFTKVMAMEWADRNIRVNALAPGTFKTEMLLEAEKQNPGLLNMLAHRSMLNRVGEVNEIVGGVLYLASDASSFMTGETLSLNGGWA